MLTYVRALSSIAASRIYALLSSNPPECQDWGKGGGDQANLDNARILMSFGTATPPLLRGDQFFGLKFSEKVKLRFSPVRT